MRFVGIDVGTTHVKAMAWEPDRQPLIAARPTPWDRSQGTLDPSALWSQVTAAVVEVLAAADAPAVTAVAVASMGEAGLFVDDRGHPLGPIVDWRRTVDSADGYRQLLAAGYDPLTLYRRTGMAPGPKFGLFRMWAQGRSREPLPSGRRWLSVADYVVYRLTGGARATHGSLAARTMAFDWQRGQWDDDLLAFAGLSRPQLPEVLWRPQAVGRVQDPSAPLAGALVTVAGHDHAVAAFGAALGTEAVLDSSGTAEPLVFAVDRPHPDLAALAAEVMWEPGLDPHRDCWVGLMPTEGGGAAETWARRVLAVDLRQWQPELTPNRPRFDPRGWNVGQARWTGVGPEVTARQLYQAVLEGVAEHIAERVGELGRLLRRDVAMVRLAGGAGHHAAWLRLRQVYLSCPLEVMDPTEGVLFGAVRWAAACAGEAGLPVPRWRPAAAPEPSA